MTSRLAPDRFALPPPVDLDLVDAGRVTGWIAGNAVGFRGFGDETEATHGAWVAHRTLARRLARTHGVRPVPVDIEPLAVRQVAGKEMILASGNPVAGLIRPGPDSRSGPDSFGFELTLPTPLTELEARAVAYLIYRTLRKSGVRWTMWRPAAPRVVAESTVPATVDTAAGTTETVDARTRDATHPRGRAAWKQAFSTGRPFPRLTKAGRTVAPLAAAAALAVGIAPFVPMPLTAVLLAGIGAGSVMVLRSRRLT